MRIVLKLLIAGFVLAWIYYVFALRFAGLVLDVLGILIILIFLGYIYKLTR